MVSLLLEDNGDISVDLNTAYKYSNIIASKAHTFGTYIFASLNHYRLGSALQSCDLAIEFYKTVAERNSHSRTKFNLATKAYKDGNHRTASLLYAELAEEGHQFADINAGILFYNYPIFNNQTFNDYNSYKYFKKQTEERDYLSVLYLADIYYTG